MEQVKRYKAVLTGRVQGVGLRVFTKNNAEQLGITGWVKNMPDGTVNAEMQGSEEQLSKLIDTIKKGNFVIKVDTFDCEEIPAVEGEQAFIIKY